jgi:hypothetical protein
MIQSLMIHESVTSTSKSLNLSHSAFIKEFLWVFHHETKELQEINKWIFVWKWNKQQKQGIAFSGLKKMVQKSE